MSEEIPITGMTDEQRAEFEKRGINTGDQIPNETPRTRRNQEAVSSFSMEDAWNKSIRQASHLIHEGSRIWNILVKRRKREVAKARTNFDLWLDNLIFQKGWRCERADLEKKLKICPKKMIGCDGKPCTGEPCRNFENHGLEIAIHLKHWQRTVQAAKEQRENRPYVPAFMEGFGDPNESSIGDLPSDGDIADMLIKANPNLKKFRNDLI